MNGETIDNRREIMVPYETALKFVRNALLHEDLRISREYDVSDTAGGRQRGMNLVRCRILCVDSPLLLLEAIALDPSAAVFLPLHIVCAHGPKTQVYWLNPASIPSKRLPVGVVPPLRTLQARIVRAMERIPANVDYGLEMSCER